MATEAVSMAPILTPVLLNVYDIGEYNGYLRCMGLGVFHSGVEVHGREYAFGAHAYSCSGIFATNPLQAPGEVVYRCTVMLGETPATPDQVADIIAELGLHYIGASYHLLQKNCNHFSSDFAYALCSRRAPAWVNRLARWVINLHCLFPPSWLPPLNPPSMDPPLASIADLAQMDGESGMSGRTSAVQSGRPSVHARPQQRTDTPATETRAASTRGTKAAHPIDAISRRNSLSGSTEDATGDKLLSGQRMSDQEAYP